MKRSIYIHLLLIAYCFETIGMKLLRYSDNTSTVSEKIKNHIRKKGLYSVNHNRYKNNYRHTGGKELRADFENHSEVAFVVWHNIKKKCEKIKTVNFPKYLAATSVVPFESYKIMTAYNKNVNAPIYQRAQNIDFISLLAHYKSPEHNEFHNGIKTIGVERSNKPSIAMFAHVQDQDKQHTLVTHYGFSREEREGVSFLLEQFIKKYHTPEKTSSTIIVTCPSELRQRGAYYVPAPCRKSNDFIHEVSQECIKNKDIDFTIIAFDNNKKSKSPCDFTLTLYDNGKKPQYHTALSEYAQYPLDHFWADYLRSINNKKVCLLDNVNSV